MAMQLQLEAQTTDAIRTRPGTFNRQAGEDRRTIYTERTTPSHIHTELFLEGSQSWYGLTTVLSRRRGVLTHKGSPSKTPPRSSKRAQSRRRARMLVFPPLSAPLRSATW